MRADSRIARGDEGAQPNDALLAALGTAVLPAELGPATSRAVADFQRWMDGYQPGAEGNHGYGTGTIQRLPADPRPRWRAQLAALDDAARRRHGAAFPSLSRGDRQAIVRAALAGVRADSLPTPLTAEHVALALLAHFYDSPAATDLCYQANIARQQCRPLRAAPQQPVPLTRRAP
ncbi:MAG TPA: gluconate 2-dehydrogenase subunit 3 family protein [Gemmatimonadaceae bacterium]|nr:gluconate 2-dehydrogenase subunit 3 family protein [Gemmatimonadaceae bacterium]